MSVSIHSSRPHRLVALCFFFCHLHSTQLNCYVVFVVVAHLSCARLSAYGPLVESAGVSSAVLACGGAPSLHAFVLRRCSASPDLHLVCVSGHMRARVRLLVVAASSHVCVARCSSLVFVVAVVAFAWSL